MAAVERNLPTESKLLHAPPLEEVASLLNEQMKSNYSWVDVQVVTCPDLTKEPFTLACKGLGGQPRLVELGGVPYLMPWCRREKLYDIRDVAKRLEVEPAFIVGPSMGPWTFRDTGAEMAVCAEVKNGKLNNYSRITWLDKGKIVVERVPDNEPHCGLIGNWFCSQGLTDKVLQIRCKKRTGSADFISCIRQILQDRYKGKSVGLGGVFVLKEGKAQLHVAPQYSKTPLHSDQDLIDWLKFFDMSPPLVAVGTLVSEDLGLDLRLSHFHSFSDHGEGGHFHIDTEPEKAEYLAYFSVAQSIHRIDRPAETHQAGRI
ncbi:ester hydrolase C11orf54 homolog isoform X2 [Bacillus rossius redtenbacheri]